MLGLGYGQCDQKKSPNVYKVGDLGKLIITKGFKKFPKSNKSPNLVTLKRIHWAMAPANPQ